MSGKISQTITRRRTVPSIASNRNVCARAQLDGTGDGLCGRGIGKGLLIDVHTPLREIRFSGSGGTKLAIKTKPTTRHTRVLLIALVRHESPVCMYPHARDGGESNVLTLRMLTRLSSTEPGAVEVAQYELHKR